MGTVCLKIVVVYSDRPAARMGARVAKSLRRHLGSDFHVAQSIWNEELLRSPKLRRLAAAEARESDIVIVATSEGAPLSDEIKGWFELWGRREHKAPSALVALLHQEPGEEDSQIAKKTLQEIARRAKMDFFYHSARSRAEDITASGRQLQVRAFEPMPC